MKEIPFNSPFISGKELYYISQAVITNQRLAGDGEFTRNCQCWLEKRLGTRKALLTHSCTAALEMAAILLDIKAGDEVIIPSYTFVSTANAFVLRGATPVFVDIRPDTLNIDERQIEGALTSKTRAIVPVHYAGVPCEIDSILRLADERGIAVVEDAAQALLSSRNGKMLGTFGQFGCLSFHETKNVISGEGGALLVNDESYIERASIIWEKGTNRKNYFAGKVDKYTWVDLGSSFLPGELTAAFLFAQFERAEEINARRVALCRLYASLLAPLAEEHGFRIPQFRDAEGENGHLFYILTCNPEERKALLQYLAKDNIQAVFHYIPLHSSPAGQRFGRCSGEMTVTDDISARLIRMPLYFELTDDDVVRCCDSIRRFYETSRHV